MAENSKNCRLLKTQKNEIFKLIQEQDGFSVSNFYWKDLLENKIHNPYKRDFVFLKLHYKDSDFYYSFKCYGGYDGGECFGEFSPSSQKFIGREKIGDWYHQKLSVEKWLEYLQREVEEPDLWQEIEKYQEVLPLAPSDELVNEPIPAYEADIMNDRLMLLSEQITKEFKLQKEESQFVRQKLNYLADAARRQPRRDWENIAVSVIMSLAIQLALAPEQAKSLFELVKNTLKGVFHLMGP